MRTSRVKIVCFMCLIALFSHGDIHSQTQIINDTLIVLSSEAYVRVGAGEENMHRKVIDLDMDVPGYYRIGVRIDYNSGDEQTNESFYLTLATPDGLVTTPVDSNAGPYRVIEDESGPPHIAWREVGKFYFPQGTSTVTMHHYAFISDQYPAFLNGPISSSGESVHFMDSVVVITAADVDGSLQLTAQTPHEIEMNGAPTPALKNGELIDYSYVIRNVYSNPIRFARLKSELPDSVSVESISYEPTARFDKQIIWDLPRIEPQDSFVIRVSARLSTEINPVGYLHLTNNAILEIPDDIDTTNNSAAATVYVFPQVNGAITLKPKAAQQRMINGSMQDLAYPGELVTFPISIKNKSYSHIMDAKAIFSFPYTLAVEQTSYKPGNQSDIQLEWDVPAIAPLDSFNITVSARVKENILPEGISQLATVAVLSVTDDVDLSDNRDNANIFALADENGKKPEETEFIPQIKLSASRVDVTDSIRVSVQAPAACDNWDLWVYTPDGNINRKFADAYISVTPLQANRWYDVDEVYRPVHLVTTNKAEQLIFEIHARDVLGNTATARATAIVNSSNYLVLDRNVFRPEMESPLDIRFKLSNRRIAQLDIYDLTGRHIVKLSEAVYDGGWNSYLWDGINHSGTKIGSGVYMVTLRSGEFNSWKKFIIVR
ncbi:T9SS type A sorting domain-containing protein [candidate division KSB1 bacterium]|nr:T9SS type A sorting domain-containing protein [candidate division KSB1 bacterium]